MTSSKSIEEQSHQDSRQRNQAQRQWSETYEKEELGFVKFIKIWSLRLNFKTISVTTRTQTKDLGIWLDIFNTKLSLTVIKQEI